MNHSRTSSDLDEEHLLAGEYEKNNYPRSQRQSRTRQPMKCNALPWSLAFNAIFLFLSAFTWIWSLRLQSKAYIPNEVYCTCFKIPTCPSQPFCSSAYCFYGIQLLHNQRSSTRQWCSRGLYMVNPRQSIKATRMKSMQDGKIYTTV